MRVPAKIIALKTSDSSAEEVLVANISKYANSQNSARQSDLSANKAFHRTVENLAQTTYCPDGVGRWFYERAAGSYKTMLVREGTTPARLKKLRQAIPTARKITKTDLAKYLNAWDQLPDAVSFGAQKNFLRFMERLEAEHGSPGKVLDVQGFKQMIAKAILYKATQRIARRMFQAFQANITTYTIAVAANRLGSKLDLDKVWLQQGASPAFEQQLAVWAERVHTVLHETASGRMVSEWAKKTECWHAVRSASYGETVAPIPELLPTGGRESVGQREADG